MLAVDVLSAGWSALFYGLACLCFLIAAIVASPRVATREGLVVNWGLLVSFGLFLFAFPSFWNNLAGT